MFYEKKLYPCNSFAFPDFSLYAQNKAIVFSNLGVENMNISIANTQYGTSSNAKGHYELPIYNRTTTVNLYYSSCIGYQDTIDGFNDLILVGQDSCSQVYLDEKQVSQPISTFSWDDYRLSRLPVVMDEDTKRVPSSNGGGKRH